MIERPIRKGFAAHCIQERSTPVRDGATMTARSDPRRAVPDRADDPFFDGCSIPSSGSIRPPRSELRRLRAVAQRKSASRISWKRL